MKHFIVFSVVYGAFNLLPVMASVFIAGLILGFTFFSAAIFKKVYGREMTKDEFSLLCSKLLSRS